MRIADEVAAALAGRRPRRGPREHPDRPRAAARAQPRGGPRARGRGARRGRRARPRSRWSTASRGSAWTTPRSRRWRSATGFVEGGRARPRAGGRAAAAPRRRRSPRPRTSPRARASACSPPAGSAACTARRARAGTSRPTCSTLAAHRHHDRVRGREVDPRRRRDARAARDAQRRACSATAPTASPASTSPTPASPSLARRHAGGGRGA